MSYRVVLWTTGHVASYAGRAIVEHPNMELVGAYAWSPEKAGRDVGELIGIDPLGIVATSDVDEILALRPDVVGYYPIMRTEAVPEHTDTICRFLEAGINVVSTANLITGRWWDAEERFAESGREGNASLFASGVNPGFVNQLMLTATGVCARCGSSRCGRRPSARATTRPSSGRRSPSATTHRSPTSRSTSTRAPPCSRTRCR